VIYFIKNGTTGHIKMGFSDDPRKYLQELQAGSADKLELIKTIEGDAAAEDALHQQFAQCQVDGKWFKPVEELLKFIVMSTLFHKKPTDMSS
jgi:hypothetical protein